jgi:hypothetical protein
MTEAADVKSWEAGRCSDAPSECQVSRVVVSRRVVLGG